MTPDEFLAARKRLGLTQAEMGERLGLSERQIRRIEQGQIATIKPPIARDVQRQIDDI